MVRCLCGEMFTWRDNRVIYIYNETFSASHSVSSYKMPELPSSSWVPWLGSSHLGFAYWVGLYPFFGMEKGEDCRSERGSRVWYRGLLD